MGLRRHRAGGDQLVADQEHPLQQRLRVGQLRGHHVLLQAGQLHNGVVNVSWFHLRIVAQQIEQSTISKLQELEKTNQVKLKTQSPLIPLVDISNVKTTSKITSNHNVTTTISELLSDTNFTEMEGLGSKLRLAMSKLAIDIPMQKAYENGHEIFLVTFDASNSILAHQLTD